MIFALSASTELVQVAEQTAPWWTNTFNQLVPLIVGSLLTLVVAFATTHWADKRRYAREDVSRKHLENREDATRWHDQLREDVANLVALVLQLDLDGDELREGREAIAGGSATREEIEEYLKLSERATELMTNILLITSAIRIIAPGSVARRAQVLSDATGTFMMTPSEATSKELRERVDLLLSEVREALNVKDDA